MVQWDCLESHMCLFGLLSAWEVTTQSDFNDKSAEVEEGEMTPSSSPNIGSWFLAMALKLHVVF